MLVGGEVVRQEAHSSNSGRRLGLACERGGEEAASQCAEELPPGGHRGLVILGAVFASLALLASPVAAQQSLTWTAGAVGGGRYATSGGMAELLSEQAGMNIKVISGGGTPSPALVQGAWAAQKPS
jgi:hypothetical protein